MNKLNEFEMSIANNPHPKSIALNDDGTWSKLDLYSHSVYMMYIDFLVKNQYENRKIARDEFITNFGFHQE